VVDSLIRKVALKHKEVAVVLTPPLSGLGFLSTGIAPRGIEPLRRNDFTIKLTFRLEPCPGNDQLVWARPLAAPAFDECAGQQSPAPSWILTPPAASYILGIYK
jgi:hypothetical protein